MTIDEDRLRHLEDKIDAVHEAVVRGFANCLQCRGEVSDMKQTLYRVPTNGDAGGLVYRFDRMEQAAKWAKGAVGAALAAVVTAIGGWFK